MRISSVIAFLYCVGVLLCNPTFAQNVAPIPPGVPEPGLIIWGSVVNATNTSQPIVINSANWSVTDNTKTAVYTASSRPPTQIFTLDGRTYYVLQVPFDTRSFGTVSLSDPASVGIDSFELKSSTPPTYTLTPTINGVLASVRSVDGAPASGGAVPVTGFSAAIRGRVIRVDLAITPPVDTYDTWAAGFFGSAGHPNAARTADPDGDGLTNEREYLAGTNPMEASSVLQILTLTMQPSQVTVNWKSVSNKSYRIESAPNVQGPWTEVGTQVVGSGSTAQTSVPRAQADPKVFYRVRVVP